MVNCSLWSAAIALLLISPLGEEAAASGPVYSPPAGEGSGGLCPDSPVGAGARLSASFTGTHKPDRTLAYGRRTLIGGHLVNPQGSDVSRAIICIEERTRIPGRGYTFAGTTTTHEDGRWFFKLPSGLSWAIRVSCRTGPEQTVTTLNLKVRAHATLHLSTHRTTPGHRVYFSGRIPGPLPGKRVVLLVGTVPGAKRNYLVRRARTDPFGRFKTAYAFTPLAFPAKFVFWALVPAQNGYPYLLGRSANRYVRVRP